MKIKNCPTIKCICLMWMSLTAVLLTAFMIYSNPHDVSLAQTNTSVNFQGKIVRNDTGNEGLNVNTGSPTCVLAGADTCDFQIIYYDAPSGGNTLGTETFLNQEIGARDGIFNLALGMGTYTAGTEASFIEIFTDNSTVYAEMKFAPGGAASYTETFSRMAVRAAPFALNSSTLDGLDSTSFVKLAPSGVQTDSTTSSSIFINKTGASGNILQLQKNSSDVLVVSNSGYLGIGDATPASPLTVGNNDLFQVDSNGDIIKIKNITYAWPSAQAGGSGYVLSNNGSGTLTWATPNAGTVTGTGTNGYNAYWTGGSSLGSEQYVALTRGGTGTTLTASNGGIVYSNATTLAVLAGTATANRVLMSGASTTPSWSTATYPSTATTSGTILRANGTNWVASTATFPNTGGTAGTILRSDGTNWVNTTATYPTTTTINQILYSNAANAVTGLATGNSAFLVTDSGGAPSFTALSNDTFTQYALLAGRAGSQTLTGSTATTSGLTLRATSNAGATTGADIVLQVGSSGGTEAMRILNSGNVGIGDTSPASLFTVGNGDLFQVNSSGNIVKINNITYSWPSAQAGASGYVLTNNGSGTLTWSAQNATVADNSLDFLKFESTLDLDSNLILNQGTYDWTQSYGGTATGFSYTSSTLTSGSLFNLSSTGIGAASNTQKVLNITTSGANTTSTQTTYGSYITNTHTGTSSTNVAGYFSASGGTNNYAAVFESGNVGIGTTTPSEKLSILGGNVKQTAYGTPVLKGSYNTSGTAFNVYVSGKYAYVADGASGLHIIDISDPSTPTFVSTYDTSGSARDVTVSGRYAYVADHSSGLHIIDVSAADTPTLVGTYDSSGLGMGVYVSGKYAYLADEVSGLQVIDIGNPSVPVLAGTYNTVGASMDVYVSGKYAYVADYYEGMHIFNISDPRNPALIDTYDSTGVARSVYVSGIHAYLADGPSGLHVIDVSDPTTVALIGTYATPTWAYGKIYASGNYVFTTEDDSGFRIIDVSDPTTPTSVGVYDTSGFAYGAFASGKYVYVADSGGGLLVFDMNGIDTPSLHAGNIETSNITINENADIGNNLFIGNGLNVGLGGALIGGDAAVGGNLRGGSITDSANVAGATTRTVTGRGVTYYLSADSQTTNSTFTTTFNITGLTDVNGSIAFINSRAIKGATAGAQQHTVVVQINGTQVSSVATANQTGASTIIENYTIVRSNGAWRVTGSPVSADSADYAEAFLSDGNVEAAEIVAMDPSGVRKVRRAGPEDKGTIVGIVSTSPAMLVGEEFGNQMTVPVALAGRVPLKVNNEGGEIAQGDPISVSSVPGVATKATKAGRIVGYALENWDGTSEKILVFVNNSWYDPGEVENPAYVQLMSDYENGLLGGTINPDGDLAVSGDLTLNGKMIVGDGTGVLQLDGGIDVDSIISEEIDAGNLTALSIGVGVIEATSVVSTNGTFGSAVINQADLAFASIGELNVSGGVLIVNQNGVGIVGPLKLDGILSSSGGLIEVTSRLKGLDGRLEVEGTLAADKLESDMLDSKYVKAAQVQIDRSDIEDASAGVGIIEAGELSVQIDTTAITESSLVFVTAHRGENGEIYGVAVDEIADGSFKVFLGEVEEGDVEFSWWVIK